MNLKLDVLRKEVKPFRKNFPRVLRRFLALIELTKFRQKYGRVRELDYEQIAARFESSGRTLYRWEAAYRSGGADALIPDKACGREATVIRGHTARKIREMRKHRPRVPKRKDLGKCPESSGTNPVMQAGHVELRHSTQLQGARRTV